MNKNISQPINIINTPINKICLIEASAGTGKTFTTSLLYLRILLGINTKKYPINKILVVTFTKLAQENLLNKIKQYILTLQESCINKKIKKTSVLKILFNYINDFNKSYTILKNAIENINHCAIYTIDKFFQKITTCNTFKFNLINKKKIINEEKIIFLEATIQYWKKYYYFTPIKITYIIYFFFKNPQKLLKIIKTFHNNINKKKIYQNYSIEKIYQNCEIFYQKLKVVKKNWLLKKNDILQIITNSSVNKRIYHKRNLLNWINKISLWANIKKDIEKYHLPKELKYFQKKVLNIKNKKYNVQIFSKIEEIFYVFLNIKEQFIHHAIQKIHIIIQKIKKKKSIINFYEISKKIYQYIKKYQYSETIRNHFPVAFIDEFQDIDTYQLKVFYEIYIKSQHPIVLIGDPKQSIYSFRKSYISNYFNIKKKIKNHYSLNTNWRSAKNINDGVNYLFSKIQYPFFTKKINFLPTITPKNNKNIFLNINEKDYSGFHILYNKKKKNIQEFQEWISEQCAQNISYWLKNIDIKKAVFFYKNKKKILQKKDIAILVQNKLEAQIIQKKLNNLNITSEYLSNNKNIYHSQESYELLWILESLLDIKNINLLKKACFTNILSISINDIFNINHDTKTLSRIIKKFNQYDIIWKKHGIFNLIQHIAIQNHQNNYYTNFDYIICIGEKLQEKNEECRDAKELITWFKKKIYEEKNKKLILTKNNNTNIKILSIHKSKGLEFPVVWIPFGISEKKYIKKKNTLSYSYNLSEEIRLLYVACTRAIVHCSIGITTLPNENTNSCTNIHHFALGYIIQNGIQMNCFNFNKEIEKIKKKKIIKINDTIEKEKNYKKNITIQKKNTYSIQKTKKITIQYNTSFSNLQKFLNKNKEEVNNKIHKLKKYNNIINIHNFPKGKIYGAFLHKILQKINFHKKINQKFLSDCIKKIQISEKWIPIIKVWVENILSMPLKKNSNMKLMNMNNNNSIKEFQFSLPIKKKITKIKLKEFFKKHDYNYKNINITNIQGMLNGSIDLVVLWEKKYYLIDYKSNWLGENNQCYNKENIQNEIINNQYDLQYQIYSLALHKYLKIKVSNYSFNNHFGGIFYIFIRSIEKNCKNNGIFFILPKKSFINNLYKLIH
ncbi:exodeoxyribonuclease V subunit beta [Buchnera aphidicola]|uniref:exodeoxyribonuclease V subunit beta n=1 Tax=Buchnera aphidicola TaxID=9 RepID=UPI00346493DE